MESVSDMYLAAALLAYGAELVEIDRSNIDRQKFFFSGCIDQIFVFSDNIMLRIEKPTFDDIRVKFAGRKLAFPPSYVDAVKRIKAIIHDV